jgi:hypothetical protein
MPNPNKKLKHVLKLFVFIKSNIIPLSLVEAAMFKHFEMIPFLVGIALGFIGLIYWKRSPGVIMKYPHPSTVEKNIYRDPNGVCYKYEAKEVDCDKNESTLRSYPIQDGQPIYAS